MKKFTIFISLLTLCFCLNAQSTGSFQQNITFSAPDYQFTRTLYFYVPTDYDANQSYKLVVGFRGGPHINAGEFRDQLTFLADSIGAIIMCPENADHFWNEEGLTKQLFQYSVDTTMSMYHIDPEFIYLTGLSYGGRHAVIVSMDTDAGSIPNIRGVILFAAGSESDSQPNYADIANFPPACICIGLDDSSNFINVSHNLYNDITANGGSAYLNEISGVGHTVAFPTYHAEMMECLNFIEDQYLNAVVSPSVLGQAVTVSPNPATDFLNISYAEDLKPQKLFLINAAGKILKHLDPNSKRIDISKIHEQIVSLVFVINGETLVKKLVVVQK